MLNDQPLLQVNDLKKHFISRRSIFRNRDLVTRAVDGISLSIFRGQIIGLVGESGCGKSTAGKTMLNLLKPTGGSVCFEGLCLFNVEEKTVLPHKEMARLRRSLQIVFQDLYASLNPRNAVLDILSEGILKHKLLPKSDVRDRCVELLQQVGLDETSLWRYPHEFSGGQRQRIGIARALSLGPSLIVCDEPTSALDVSVQSQILNLMLDLKETLGLTYLFISHNLGVVRHFCDVIAVMYLGKIVEIGLAAEVVEDPLHPYSSALVSSMPKSHPLEQRQRIRLTGGAPGAASIPSGCRFHTRCPVAIDRCAQEEPALVEHGDGRLVACHLLH